MSDDDFEAGLQRRKQQREARNRSMRGWTIGVGIVVGLVSAGRALGTGLSGGASIAFNIGEALGGAIAGGLLIAGLGYLALWLLAGRRLKADGGGGRFGLLFLIAVLIGAPLSLLHACASGGFNAALEAVNTEERARLEADMAVLAVRERELLTPLPLSREMLGQRGGVERARANVRALRALQQERLRLFLATGERHRARVQALDASPSVLAQFDEVRRAEDERAQAISTVSLQILDNSEAQLDLLARNPGKWAIQDDEVAFSNVDDLSAFSALQAEMQALKVRLDSLTAEDQAN